MRCAYKGYKPEYGNRVAEIGYCDEEENLLCRIAELMEGCDWKIEIVGSGYAYCEVCDKDDYNQFMCDWKECKRLARTAMKGE